MKSRNHLFSATFVMLIVFIVSAAISSSCAKKQASPLPPIELAKASRIDTNGWISVHLEGNVIDLAV